MKIFKTITFILILMLPIFVHAITFGNYDSGVVGANEYINKYQDRNKYLNFDMKYEFRDNNSYKNNDFKYGGLLSVFEYNTSKKGNGSYLAIGREYWTLSKDGSNQYYVDNTLLSKNPDEQSGIRVTEFVKPEVNVKGKGTYVNPWMFREQFSVEARSSNKSQGTVSPAYQMINPGSKARLTISPLTGYKYSNSDCHLLYIPNNNCYDTQIIKRDTVCTIYFEIRKITINYSCTGGSGSVTSQTIKYNDPYTIAAYSCTKVGYTQTGWKTSSNVTYNSGSYDHMTLESDTLDLQPVWEANTYTITYDANGGTGAPGVTSYTYSESGTVALSLTEPKKDNNVFVGWSKSSNTKTATYKAGDGFNKSTADDTTLYAVWCGAGNYKNGLVCTSCPSGYTSAVGATAQSSCYISVEAGKYKTTATGSTKSNCAAGTYSAAHKSYYNVSDSCTSCPSGYTSAVGSTQKSNCTIHCEDNYRVATKDAQCTTKCATGYFHKEHDISAGQTSGYCAPISYTIKYYLNKGEYGDNHPTSIEYDDEVIISNPKKTATATFKVSSRITCEDGSTTCSNNYTKTGNFTFTGWDIDGMDTTTHYYGRPNDLTSTKRSTLDNVTGTRFKNLRSTPGTVTFDAGWTKPTIRLPKITRTGYTCVWTNPDLDDKKSGGTWKPSGVLNRTFTAECDNNTITITLDDKDAEEDGTNKIYIKYNEAVCLSKSCPDSKKMTTGSHPIIAPSSSGYRFDGYYTSDGTQMINSKGFRTSNLKTNSFDKNTTLYAQWSSHSHSNHHFYAIGSTLWDTTNPEAWCINNTCGTKLYKAYAVYCTECGMSADYYKFSLGYASDRPSRVSSSCPNGGTNWIRVDDSSLSGWNAVRKHSVGRFRQLDRGDVAEGCKGI